ncbi:MAG: cupredoxin domain-containing protein [Acidimicrobiales bacterium]
MISQPGQSAEGPGPAAPDRAGPGGGSGAGERSGSVRTGRRRRRLAGALVVLASGLALTACSPTPANTAHGSREIYLQPNIRPSSAVIRINNDKFPAVTRVKAGQGIAIINDDSFSHGVAADNGSFRVGPIAPFAATRLVINTPGNYGYHDPLTPGMHGEIVVTK